MPRRASWRWPGATAVVSVFALAVLVAASSASAATTVGQLFAPNTNCTPNETRLQLGVAAGNSYAVPSSGVLTSWSFQAGTTPLTSLQFKVARPQGGNVYKIVGSTPAGNQVANTVNTTPAAQIPVLSGDVLGISYGTGQCESGGGPPEDLYGDISGDQAFGSTAGYGTFGGGRIPVQAVIEPGGSNHFKIDIQPRITCAGICHVILVQIVFDSAGRVVVEQALPGELSAPRAGESKKGKPLVKRLSKAVKAGANKLKLKLTGAAQTRLREKGKLRIKLNFTFTPTGGTPSSQVRAVTLRLRHPSGA
jgi:hypothetical protein